jgi:hypothetical protein
MHHHEKPRQDMQYDTRYGPGAPARHASAAVPCLERLVSLHVSDLGPLTVFLLRGVS